MINKINKPIAKLFVLVLIFLLVTISLGKPIQVSIENILLSKAKVHSQTNKFALTPINPEKYQQGSRRISLMQISRTGSSGELITSDGRITALRQFLMDYNSPMYPYANVFVTEADKYGLDWRLAAAISGVESGFGLLPVRVNNAWGWRGGAGGDFNSFDSWGHGIEVVTRRLALGYGIHMTPLEIEPIYCPPCGRNPNHPWANGVTKFMNQMEMYLIGF